MKTISKIFLLKKGILSLRIRIQTAWKMLYPDLDIMNRVPICYPPTNRRRLGTVFRIRVLICEYGTETRVTDSDSEVSITLKVFLLQIL